MLGVFSFLQHDFSSQLAFVLFNGNHVSTPYHILTSNIDWLKFSVTLLLVDGLFIYKGSINFWKFMWEILFICFLNMENNSGISLKDLHCLNCSILNTVALRYENFVFPRLFFIKRYTKSKKGKWMQEYGENTETENSKRKG